MDLANLLGHYLKVESGKKMICNSYRRYNGENRDFYNYFLVISEITIKVLIVLVRLILEGVGIDGFTGPRREIDIRYEFDLELFLKGLGCK